MFCQKCGNEMPDDSAFCPKCATPTGVDGSPAVTPFTPVQTLPQNMQPKKKTKKGCLIALLIPAVLAVVFVLYCIVSVVLEGDSETTTTAQTSAATTKAPAQTLKISADKLFEAYNADRTKADKLYKGKLLEITGTLLQDSFNANAPEVYLHSGDIEEFYAVVCFIKPDGLTRAKSFTNGTDATVIGICSGVNSDYDIILKNSYVK